MKYLNKITLQKSNAEQKANHFYVDFALKGFFSDQNKLMIGQIVNKQRRC